MRDDERCGLWVGGIVSFVHGFVVFCESGCCRLYGRIFLAMKVLGSIATQLGSDFFGASLLCISSSILDDLHIS